MRGQLQLDGGRESDTFHAHGEWQLTAEGDCGPLVSSGGERLEITATRISLDTTVPYESATSLAAKFLPPSPLLEPAQTARR